ncbi:translation termination factor eRF1 [Botryosphaeria dothidea]
MSAPQANDAEKNIEIWKVKKLIKRLEAARGNGTSMISLIIPPKDQVSRAAKMLAEEFGTASNIKSRVNRLSVLSAITSTQQRLKLYSKVPPNGLVIYCGEIITQEGKERKINIDFEPFKPINTSLYLCDNKFHTEALSELLESDQKFGFIIMDGNGALFGTLSGNTREVVHKFSVDLPKKHGRGGQSALRFARLREEKRHNYVRKVAELAVQNFITNDKVNVAGLILAGSADFKNDLNQSDLFDQRLQAKVIKVVDVSYGGENGFNQAIELASETLSNVKFIQEKKLINRYFDEISQDSGKVCYGIEDTLKALELGAAEILIVYENLEVTRWALKDSEGSEVILHTNKNQEEDRSLFMDKSTGQEMEIVDQMPFLEWLAERYRDFGATLEFVSDRSSEGNQFVKGFGGIGAILRYKVNFEQLAEYSDDDEFYDASPEIATPGTLTAPRFERQVDAQEPREDGHFGVPEDQRQVTPWRLRPRAQIDGFSDGKEEEPDAALDTFDESVYAFEPVVNIEDVFSAVQAGAADYGVVPIENSSNGAVVFTLDLFADLKDRYPHILICGEAYVRIEHCLLGFAPPSPPTNASSGAATPTRDAPDPTKPRARPLADLSRVRKLYSHPQAWGQCRGFLNAYLRGVERQDCSSTSRAAEEAARDASGASAAVSSATAAKLQGLDFLAKGINDRDDNTTRFFVLRRREGEEAEEGAGEGFRPKGWAEGAGGDGEMEAWKSLVSFTVDHNDPGALADSLAVFKPYKLNLTSINTRPSGVEKWNYIFFVEFRGRRLAGKEGAVNAALRDLGSVARSWRWLGSWESKLAT